MYNLLKFLIKYHAVFLFLFLEITAAWLVVQYNSYQKARFINQTLEISGSIYNSAHNISSYLSLKEENEQLIIENTQLKSLIKNPIFSYASVFSHDSFLVCPSLAIDTFIWYAYTPAKIIHSTVYQQANMFFINKGEYDQIHEGMGILHRDGIVGVVTNTSSHFAMVMPVIHKDFKTTATIKNQGYFGNLSWPGKDPMTALLTEIPGHVEVSAGDTIVASGFSSRFPAGTLIGFVKEQHLNPGTGFLEVDITLSVDFRKIQYVYAAEQLYAQELDSLKNAWIY